MRAITTGLAAALILAGSSVALADDTSTTAAINDNGTLNQADFKILMAGSGS